MSLHLKQMRREIAAKVECFSAFLAALVTSILCLAYCVFVDPSIVRSFLAYIRL